MSSTTGYDIVADTIRGLQDSIRVLDRIEMNQKRISELADAIYDQDALTLGMFKDLGIYKVDTVAEAKAIIDDEAFSIIPNMLFVVETKTLYKLSDNAAQRIPDDKGIIEITGDATKIFISIAGQYITDHTGMFYNGLPITGFVDNTKASTSFANATRTFTLAPSGADPFSIIQNGKRYDIDTSLSIQIPDTTSGYYIYFNEGVLNYVAGSAGMAILNYAIVGYVYWNATESAAQIVAENEMHESVILPFEHLYKHTFFRTQYNDGLALGSFTADGDGSSEDHWKFAVASGDAYDEDIRIQTDGIAVGDKIPPLYRVGTEWVLDDTEDRVVVDPVTGRIMYNNAGTLTAVDNNKFMLVFPTLINDGTYKIVNIIGNQQYANLPDLRDNAADEITSLITDGLPVEEALILGAVAYKTADAYTNTKKAAIVKIDGANYIDYRKSNVSLASSGTNDHGNLIGLSDDDHKQYALLDGRDGDVLKIGSIQEQAVGDGVDIEDINITDDTITADEIKALMTAGFKILSSNGTLVATFGSGGGNNMSTSDGLSVGGTLMADTFNEKTADNGIDIEGINVKDGIISVDTIKTKTASGDMAIQNYGGTDLIVANDSGIINEPLQSHFELDHGSFTITSTSFSVLNTVTAYTFERFDVQDEAYTTTGYFDPDEDGVSIFRANIEIPNSATAYNLLIRIINATSGNLLQEIIHIPAGVGTLRHNMSGELEYEAGEKCYLVLGKTLATDVDVNIVFSGVKVK